MLVNIGGFVWRGRKAERLPGNAGKAREFSCLLAARMWAGVVSGDIDHDDIGVTEGQHGDLVLARDGDAVSRFGKFAVDLNRGVG